MDHSYVEARLKLDNSSTINFFSTISSVLLVKGLVSEKDTDELRSTLTAMQTEESAATQPTLFHLVDQNSSVLSVLLSRFGDDGLCHNLLRYSLRPLLLETKVYCSALGKQLIESAKLNFNREISLMQGGKLEKRILASSLLADCATAIAECAEGLDKALERISKLIPQAMVKMDEVDEEVNRLIAESLDFTGVEITSFPEVNESRSRRTIGFSLDGFADALEQLAKAIPASDNPNAHVATSVGLDRLRSLASRIYAAGFVRSGNLALAETQRISFVRLVLETNCAVKELGRGVADLVSTIQGCENGKDYRVPENILRKIQSELIADGVPPDDAGVAAGDLSRYVFDHSVMPSELISSEVKKISASFNDRTLTILRQKEPDGRCREAQVPEKNRIYSITETLKKVFGKHLATVPKEALIVLLAFLGSCGVKTAPISDRINPRPEVPYRATQPQITNTASENSLGKNRKDGKIGMTIDCSGQSCVSKRGK